MNSENPSPRGLLCTLLPLKKIPGNPAHTRNGSGASQELTEQEQHPGGRPASRERGLVSRSAAPGYSFTRKHRLLVELQDWACGRKIWAFQESRNCGGNAE